MIAPQIFVPEYYLASNPDIATNKKYGNINNAITHFKKKGIYQGRSPNIFFDPKYYQGFYDDLPAAFGLNQWYKLWEHWCIHGIKEGRRGSQLFDPKFYLTHHEDLLQAFGEDNYPKAYEHWLFSGVHEGRVSVPELETTPFLQSLPPNNPTQLALSTITGPDIKAYIKDTAFYFICNRKLKNGATYKGFEIESYVKALNDENNYLGYESPETDESLELADD